MTEIHLASAAVAARQAAWIAGLEPWRSLGYTSAGLGRFLRRMARGKGVLVGKQDARGPVDGVLTLQEGVLLGNFVSLLAVRPEAAGRGLGRRLIVAAAARTAPARRWLYVSADAENAAALAFYRKLGFRRVGRLPDLVRAGRVELLLRTDVTG